MIDFLDKELSAAAEGAGFAAACDCTEQIRSLVRILGRPVLSPEPM